jgi:xanthine dehydrogenase accessory factor
LRDARRALADSALAGLPRDTTVALGPTLGQCCGGQVSLRWRWLAADVLADWPAVPPQFHLQLHGAGHVGQALVRLLVGLDCTVEWIDEREDAFGEAPVAAHIQRLTSDAPEAEVAHAPAGSRYLVMSHRHDLDQRIVEAVLVREDAAWLGLIGSATKRARFEHRLLERGLSPAQLTGLHCPIGLPGIRGKTPEVIAIAVAAQLLQNFGPTN